MTINQVIDCDIFLRNDLNGVSRVLKTLFIHSLDEDKESAV